MVSLKDPAAAFLVIVSLYNSVCLVVRCEVEWVCVPFDLLRKHQR